MMSEAREHRGRPPFHRCEHAGPVLTNPVGEGGPYTARCLLCGLSGPERATSMQAAEALWQMAVGKARDNR
jgi:hypothetical protein